MTSVNVNTRLVVSTLALLSIVIHSGGDMAILVAVAAGGSLLLLGIWSMFRAAAVAGFLVIVTVTCYFVDVETLTTLQGVLFASIGLLGPFLAIGWAALGSEDEHAYELDFRTRQVALAALFATACIVAVPVTTILTSFLAPSMMFGMSTMLELAIILIVATTPVMYLLALTPTQIDPGHEGRGVDDEGA